MSRVVNLFRRRVPIYVSLPVIVICGVAGYVASTRHRPPASTAVGLLTQAALPIDEIDLPTPAMPAAKGVERRANMHPGPP